MPRPEIHRREDEIENAGDDTHRRDGNCEGKGADHPFTVTSYTSAPNRDESDAGGGEQQSAKEDDRNSLADPGVRHQEPEVHPGQSADPRSDDRDPTRPAMKLAVAFAHASHQLQRCEEEKDGTRDDMQKRPGRMRGESAVERSQLTRAFVRDCRR